MFKRFNLSEWALSHQTLARVWYELGESVHRAGIRKILFLNSHGGQLQLLSHQTLVLYFMIVLAFIGVGSYLRLGQAEDPDFTFKLMVVQTRWPGASADEAWSLHCSSPRFAIT